MSSDKSGEFMVIGLCILFFVIGVSITLLFFIPSHSEGDILEQTKIRVYKGKISDLKISDSKIRVIFDNGSYFEAPITEKRNSFPSVDDNIKAMVLEYRELEGGLVNPHWKVKEKLLYSIEILEEKK